MKVSIITINFNNANGLERTIKSVCEQTYQDIEYIIIDGGSTDNSVDVIKVHEDKISYWVSESDKGIYNAMNKGTAQAHGEYCLFLNSGDKLFSPKSLENVIQQVSDADIISCDLIVDDDEINGYVSPPDEITPAFMFRRGVPHPSTLIKTSVIKQYDYREDFKIISDWIFFYETLIRNDASYQHISLPLSVFYTDGISSKNKNKIKEEGRRYVASIFSERELKERQSQAYKDFIDRQFLSERYNKAIHNVIKFFCWLQNLI